MPDFDKNDQQKLKDRFFQDKEKVTKEDLNKAIIEGEEKINSLLNNIPGVLKDLWQDIVDMWSMLKDYREGRYDVPWKTIAAIVVALLYFISPIDLLPDFIPGLGYIDDAFVIGLAMKFIGDDIEKYRNLKKSITITKLEN
jgi:uncharacterized membrane protein YkvA (DUF1232 family)